VKAQVDRRGKEVPACPSRGETIGMKSSRSRQTGTTITLYSSDELGLESEYKWHTVCEEHGYQVGHPTKACAIAWMAQPKVWCEECQQQTNEREEKK